MNTFRLCGHETDESCPLLRESGTALSKNKKLAELTVRIGAMFDSFCQQSCDA